MIKKILTIAVIAGLFASCTGDAENNQKDNADLTPGEVVESDIPVIALGEFNAKAGDFVDKQVQVTGIVDHLCKHGAKRLLLVSDDADVHVDSEERFDEALSGSEITVTGIVREFRVDEAYCLKMEDDNIQNHKSGDADEDIIERKRLQIEWYRDSMKTSDVDHLSFYTLDYVSHKLIK
ncbi:MAG: hypothetical protein ABII90_05075 [Bacteroidota bacterium]